MYEELVKRLKIAAEWAGKGFCITPSLCLEAANAIEELTDKNVGKWLFWQDDPDANVYECSACHESLTLNEGTPEENNFNFCPFCGLPMIGGDKNV